MGDLLVERRQDELGAGQRRQKGGLAAGTVEHAEPDVDRPEAAAEAGGEVEVPRFVRRLVRGQVVIRDEPSTWAAVPARKGALAVPGQREQLQRPPLPGPGDMGHGLTHLGPLVRILDEVGLVDDINQGARFDDSQEHAVEPETQLPFALADVAVQEKKGLAEIAVRAVRVPGVVSVKRCDRDASAVLVLHVSNPSVIG